MKLAKIVKKRAVGRPSRAAHSSGDSHSLPRDSIGAPILVLGLASGQQLSIIALSAR
jgi:hypothetical protein